MERLTFQQARAEIVRQVVRSYDRDSILLLLDLLGYRAEIPSNTPKRTLAYKIAWQLLPAGPDSRKRNMSTRNEQTRPDSLLSALLSADLSVGRQGKEAGNDAR